MQLYYSATIHERYQFEDLVWLSVTALGLGALRNPANIPSCARHTASIRCCGRQSFLPALMQRRVRLSCSSIRAIRRWLG